MTKLTKREFMNKIDSEGGYESAFILYGLDIDDLDENALSPDLREELSNRIEEFVQSYIELNEFIIDYLHEDETARELDELDEDMLDMEIELDSDNNENYN